MVELYVVIDDRIYILAEQLSNFVLFTIYFIIDAPYALLCRYVAILDQFLYMIYELMDLITHFINQKKEYIIIIGLYYHRVTLLVTKTSLGMHHTADDWTFGWNYE